MNFNLFGCLLDSITETISHGKEVGIPIKKAPHI